MLKWDSGSWPASTLLYGTLPKLEPMLDAAFSERQNGVRSINPIGTMQTLPSRRYAGTALPSGPASHGLLPPPVAPCGRGFGFAMEGIAEGSGAGPGITGVRLATLPRFGLCAVAVVP